MTLFAASSNQRANISISNPNNVPITVAMDLVIGDTRSLSTRGSATGTIPAKSTGQFTVTVPMPTAEGSYPVNFWLDFDSQTAKYDVNDTIEIFALKQPTVTLSVDRSLPKAPGETAEFSFSLVNQSPVEIAISNMIIQAGGGRTTLQSFTIPANSSKSGSATLVLPSLSESAWPISVSWDGLSTPVSFLPLPAILPPVLKGQCPAGTFGPGGFASIQWRVTNPNLTETLRIIRGLVVFIFETPTSKLGYAITLYPSSEIAPGGTLSGAEDLQMPDNVGNQTYTGRIECAWNRRAYDLPDRVARGLMSGTLQTTSQLLEPTVVIGL